MASAILHGEQKDIHGSGFAEYAPIAYSENDALVPLLLPPSLPQPALPFYRGGMRIPCPDWPPGEGEGSAATVVLSYTPGEPRSASSLHGEEVALVGRFSLRVPTAQVLPRSPSALSLAPLQASCIAVTDLDVRSSFSIGEKWLDGVDARVRQGWSMRQSVSRVRGRGCDEGAHCTPYSKLLL